MARISGGSAREIYAHMPEPLVEGFFTFYRALWDEGNIEAPLKELMRYRSAQLNACEH